MGSLLIKLFIKNPDKTDDPDVREQYGKFAGVVGIVSNLLLCLMKVALGLLSRSIAIIADGINNLADASSSIITLVGFKLAAQPEDEDHPYGHARIEYLTGLFVSIFIIVIGLQLLKTSIDKILHPEPVEFSYLTVGMLAAAILIKLWQSLFNSSIGKKIKSVTLTATAADSRNDVIATSAVLASLLFGKFTGLQIDGYMGCLVALFIVWSGIQLVRETSSPLLGEAPDPHLVESIRQIVCRDPSVLGIHDLMVHDYGPGRRFASVHAELDHRIDPLVAHEILDEIERQAKRDLHVDLVIHYDPIVTDDPEVTAVHTRVTQILRGIDPRLSIHDFRMVSGPHHANVIFDMVIPAEYEDKTAQLRREVEAQLQDGKKVYHLVITFDTAAFNEMTKEAQG